jgi:hypothetical protein
LPAIDEAALLAARHTDRMLEAARASGFTRWVTFLEPLPDRLRDGDLRDTRWRRPRPGGVRAEGLDPGFAPRGCDGPSSGRSTGC